MRQAGRYLPEYRAVREKAGHFIDLCFNPELAAEVTLQPVERFDLDAAILFADILLVPLVLGQEVWFEKGEGPRLSPPVTEKLSLPGNISIERLAPVFETVARVRQGLSSDKALIGFAGAPWTVATYMMAGRGIKDPASLRSFFYQNETYATELIDALVEATTAYLIGQARAGADVLKVFESWAVGLPPAFLRKWSIAPICQIIRGVRTEFPDKPFIVFPRGAGPVLCDYAAQPEIGALGLDTGMDVSWAAKALPHNIVLQGALDPLLVVQGGSAMFDAVDEIKAGFGDRPYIFNLGHGFVPETPPEHVAALTRYMRTGSR